MKKTGLTLKPANEQIKQVGDQYVLARQYDMAVNHRGALHSHAWYQLMYASSGLLNVKFANQFMVVPPHKAIWLPPDNLHQVVAPTGAKFRSLYFRPDQVVDLGEKSKVFTVSPLVRELILSVVSRCDTNLEWQEKDDRLLKVLFDQLADQPVSDLSLLVPKDSRVIVLVSCLQSDPSNALGLSEWADKLGMSSRTLSRIFLAETGIGFKEWRQKVRLLHSLSLLEQGLSVTQVALDVGYHSSSAFTHAFHQLFGVAPKRYFV